MASVTVGMRPPSQNRWACVLRFEPNNRNITTLNVRFTLQMPRGSPTSEPAAAVEAALERLGRNIRIARLRRRMPQAQLAERIGVSRFVVANMERGKAGTSVAAYVGALWALGLLEQLRPVADPAADAEGVALEHARRPKRARGRMVLDDDF